MKIIDSRYVYVRFKGINVVLGYPDLGLRRISNGEYVLLLINNYYINIITITITIIILYINNKYIIIYNIINNKYIRQLKLYKVPLKE